MAGAAAACVAGAGRAERRGATVLYASGADLQSINPLLTVHPLAKQVQRYVLLTTLARYDSALTPQPYLARAWQWSGDRRVLTIWLRRGIRWHDGRRTTAADVAWTLNAARSAQTGYPRLSDLAAITIVDAPNDSTVLVRFAEAQPAAFPDVFTDLAVLPAHKLDTVPPVLLRQAAWNARPVGNGPFRFVRHEPNRRWVFERNPDFPAELGGPPALERFIVVVVDEPTTKLAALTSGELDFAGIQPAHAAFVRADPQLTILDFPQMMTYGIVFNTRRPPFDDVRVRLAAALALDRREIIDGYLFGFGRVADGPVPPEMPGYVAPRPLPTAPDSARNLLVGREREDGEDGGDGGDGGDREGLVRATDGGQRGSGAGADDPGPAGGGRFRGPHPPTRVVGVSRPRVRSPARVRCGGARDAGGSRAGSHRHARANRRGARSARGRPSAARVFAARTRGVHVSRARRRRDEPPRAQRAYGPAR